MYTIQRKNEGKKMLKRKKIAGRANRKKENSPHPFSP